MKDFRRKGLRFLAVVFFLLLYFFWGEGGGQGGGRVDAMFLDGSFFKRHLVTSSRSAKLKQIFGVTRQTRD